APRKVPLRVVFTLQTPAAAPAPPVDFGNPPPAIVSIECSLVPTELCKSGRERVIGNAGSPLTREKFAEMESQLAGLDDHLHLSPRKLPNGMALSILLRYETGSD